ncbi:MAG: cation:proton antiporter [Brachymonas sp.]|nr:cation:proton antiporter [Brachymonas sp.]
MVDFFKTLWRDAVDSHAGLPVLQWSLLLAVAALAGHVGKRYLRLPKIVGFAAVGALAGLSGFVGAAWPLRGVGLFLLELGIAVMLFEAGARLPLRWFRHNPVVLVQSVAESLLTFMAAYVLLRKLGLGVQVTRALSVIAVAASPSVLMSLVANLRASGPVTDRALALTTLNTLYVLTIGTTLLRSIDRAEVGMLESLASSATLLFVSLLIGAVLAGLLTHAFRWMRQTSEDTILLIMALVAASTAVAPPLGGSAPLAALLGGILLKQVHPRPWVWPRQLGTAASMLTVLMFVLVPLMAAKAYWSFGVLWIALMLIAVRVLAKLLSLLATGPGSGMSLKKSVWVAGAMVPMSSVELLLTSQFVAASPNIGFQVAAVALPTILITELFGAALVAWLLSRAGEAGAPPGRSPLPPATGTGSPP